MRRLDSIGDARSLASLDFDQLVEEQLVVFVDGDVFGGGYKFICLLPVLSLLLRDLDLLPDFTHLWHRLYMLNIGTMRLDLRKF